MTPRVDRRVALLLWGVFLAVLAVNLVRGADGTPVSLRVEGSTNTFFDGTVHVAPCTVIDTDGKEHALPAVAACALQEAAHQQGFTIVFQDFGFGLFLKAIGTDDTPADFSQGWNFWVNYDPASVGLDTYAVAMQDRILLAFAPYPGVPLRVTAPEQADVDVPIPVQTEKRVGDFDDQFVWHGRWEPAEGATLHVGENTYPVPSGGEVSVTISAPGSIPISADGTGFVRSAKHTITVPSPSPSPSPSPTSSPSPTPTPSPTPSATPTPSPSPTPVSDVSEETRQAYAGAALSYLRSRQSSSGEIDGSMVTGWSAIAFGAHGERGDSIRNGRSLLDALATSSLTLATDIERQILAVRAAGANPHAFAGSDLVRLLHDRVRNGQIGEEALINDDIFGVLAFLAAGESAQNASVQSGVQAILQKQAADGGFENVDITAAAIQALRAYAVRGGSSDANDAVNRSRTYLRVHQDQFGGFGENSATTAWGLQAIIALGEDPSTWRTSDSRTPWTALLRYQHASGGFGWKSRDDVSAFMTAYAVPALLSAPWPVTLLSIETVTAAATLEASPTPTATSLPRVAGSTAIATVSPLSTASSVFVTTPSPSPAEVIASPSPAVLAATETRASVPKGFTPLAPVDRHFALSMFGVANVGVGLSLARIIGKLRGIV